MDMDSSTEKVLDTVPGADDLQEISLEIPAVKSPHTQDLETISNLDTSGPCDHTKSGHLKGNTPTTLDILDEPNVRAFSELGLEDKSGDVTESVSSSVDSHQGEDDKGAQIPGPSSPAAVEHVTVDDGETTSNHEDEELDPLEKSHDEGNELFDGSELKSPPRIEYVSLHEDEGSDDEKVITLDDSRNSSDDDSCPQGLARRVDSFECMQALLDNLDHKEQHGGLDDNSDTDTEDGKRGDEDDDEGMPMIRMNSSIFEDDDEDDGDDGGMDPETIQGMLEVDMDMGDGNTLSFSDSPSRRDRPRRQAALVASSTIKQISHLEESKNDDIEYLDTVSSRRRPSSGERRTAGGEKQRCHQCKSLCSSLVVVRQYGIDIHLCSNQCFNAFRNPDPATRPLPCAKCGAVNRDNEPSKMYYWETMNFCSEGCVGNFQLQIGSKCATCTKKTPWNCIGKYCVRFGSDIRQFCTAACLESYKKNARVCFHCQLDIKKLGNVVLANIPLKNSPKEFCSQDCVEQYVDQNASLTRVRTTPLIVCHICHANTELFQELVTVVMSYKVCSSICWDTLKEQLLVTNVSKCESCPKYINAEVISSSPSSYVSSEKRSYGFCSATCKNVFVLKTRQIKPCTTCQVKKYNYDLIQHPSVPSFAVCSLNCLPRPSQHVAHLKEKVLSGTYVPPPSHTVESLLTVASTPATTVASTQHYTVDLSNGDVSLNSGGDVQIAGVSSTAPAQAFLNDDGTYDMNSLVQYYISQGSDVRQMSDTEVLELQTDGTLRLTTGDDHDDGMEDDDSGVPVEGEDVDLEDERWGDCSEFVVIRAPEPPEQRNKGCQVKPYPNPVETQTDPGELADLPRIQPKVKVLIVPVPVFIPFPVFMCCQPVPVPYPIGIPVPIPVPVIIDSTVTDCAASAVESAETEAEASTPIPIPDQEVRTGRDKEPAELEAGSATLEEDSVTLPSPLGLDQDAEDENEAPGSPLKQVAEPMSESSPVAAVATSPHTETGATPEAVGETSDLYQELDDVEMMDTSELQDVGAELASEPTQTEMDADPLLESVDSEPDEVQPKTPSTPLASGLYSGSPRSVANSPAFSTLLGTCSPAPGSPSITGRARGSRAEFGLRAWRLFFGDDDPAQLEPEMLSEKLNEWTLRGTKAKGDRYEVDALFYFLLGVQNHIRQAGRPDQIFYEGIYAPFVSSLTAYAEQEMSKGRCIAKVEEDHVWEANELGPVSPGVLIFTLIYYIYKYFGLKIWEEHGALEFSQVKILERKNPEDETSSQKYVIITGITSVDGDSIEVGEEPENPFRCMVKLLEFYSTKSECTTGNFYKSIKSNHDARGAWYGDTPLGQMDLYRMLVRAQMIYAD